MSLLKKLFVFTLLFTTIATVSGLNNTVKAAGSYGAGSLLALQGATDAAVYYIGSDGMKYVFPDSKTFFTWYPDFSDVVRVPVSELDMYEDGGAVTYRPGTYMVTHMNTAKVYAVSPGGTLHWIPDEATAIDLYGSAWASMVKDVIPGYFSSSYVTGADLADEYPTGTLVKVGETVYYIDEGTKRPFADADAFEANGFDWDFVLDATSLSGYTDGSSITGEEEELSGYMPGEDSQTPVDGDLTVSLYNTPDGMNMPEGSPNDFFGFKLTAGSEDASIEAITLTFIGLGSATELDDVTIYNNGVKVGTSKAINSDREATFNFSTPIEVDANSSVSLMAKATIATAASAGETYGLSIDEADDIVTGGTVGGSFPIEGELMTNVEATLGTATISGVSNTDVTVDFGEDDVLLSEFTINQANSEEPILWETARFRNGGTNSSDVVDNLRIEVAGDVVDSEVSLDDKYVTFDMDGLLIAKGQSVSVEVYGDVGVASVGNTIDLYIDNASDFVFMGQTHGFGIQLTSIADLDAAGDGIKATLAAGDFTIDMDKEATPSKDVRPGEDNVVLATVSFTSNGENATINDITNTADTTAGLDFYVQGTGLGTTEATNFELRDVDSGVIYDITETVSTTLAGWTLAMADEINLTAGVTRTFEFRVDLSGPNDSTPIDDGDTLKVYLESSAMNVTGDDSDAAITDITPASVSSAIATVRNGSLTVSTVSLSNKSVVPGAGSDDPIVVYKAGLEVGEASDLTLTSYRLDADATYFAAFDDNYIAQLDLYIIEDGVDRLLKSKSNAIVNDGLATAYIDFTSLDTTNRVLEAGTDVELEVRAIFTAASPTSDIQFALEAVDTAAYIDVKDSDNTTVVETIENALTDSRLITISSKGTLKMQLKTTDPSANDDFYIRAGSETLDRYFAELVFTTTNEDIELIDLVLQEYGDSSNDDVKLVKLYDDEGNVVAYKSPTVDGHVLFEEADFVGDANILPADESTSFFVGVLTKSMNADGDPEGTADFDEGIRYGMATSSVLTPLGLAANQAVVARGVDSGEDIDIVEDVNGTLAVGEYTIGSTLSKSATTTGSLVTSITNAMSDGVLSGGTSKTIGKYTFNFDNGSNRTADPVELKAQLRQLIITIASSTTTRASNVAAYIEGDSGNKTTAVQPNSSNVATIDLTTLDTDTNLVDGTVTLVIVADINTSGDNQYIQTEINDLSTDFTYNGNHDDGSTYWSNARIEGMSEVIGGTLSL